MQNGVMAALVAGALLLSASGGALASGDRSDESAVQKVREAAISWEETTAGGAVTDEVEAYTKATPKLML